MERAIIISASILSTSYLFGISLQMLNKQNSSGLNYTLINGFTMASMGIFMNVFMLDIIDKYIKVN